MYTIASFYHFFDFAHFEKKRAEILGVLKAHDIKGSVLIASEGFNGTIAGAREGIDKALCYLETLGGAFDHKESFAEKPPFPRTKVRLKKETISIGEPCPKELVGEYIDAKDWNDFISNDDVILIDARNRYETHLGKFHNAIDPDTQNFRELPTFVRENFADAKRKKIATYCTGGIRCEKFTAWLKNEGFEEVYHLKGGILKYLEEIPPEQSAWQGECFVFDHRIAVGHGLAPSDTITMCHCGHPLTAQDRDNRNYVEGKHCGYCGSNDPMSL